MSVHSHGAAHGPYTHIHTDIHTHTHTYTHTHTQCTPTCMYLKKNFRFLKERKIWSYPYRGGEDCVCVCLYVCVCVCVCVGSPYVAVCGWTDIKIHVQAHHYHGIRPTKKLGLIFPYSRVRNNSNSESGPGRDCEPASIGAKAKGKSLRCHKRREQI